MDKQWEIVDVLQQFFEAIKITLMTQISLFKIHFLKFNLEHLSVYQSIELL